jgi:hypothetical protein
MLLHGIQMDVLNVLLVILKIPDAMVGKPALPDLGVRSEFVLDAIGKPTFDKLSGAFQRDKGRDEEMKVIGHQNEFMQQIGVPM